MAVPIYRMWVNGQEEDGSADLIPVENPANGNIFALYIRYSPLDHRFVRLTDRSSCHAASVQDVDKTINIAHSTYMRGSWANADRHDRANVLENIANVLANHLPDLITLEVQQTGRPIREMRAQVPSLTKWFKYYASVLRTEERPVLPTTGKLHNWIERRPLGVVVQITPFNHPLLIAVKKIAPALAAGNSIVLKPSELTPLTSVALGRLMGEAGLPPGVFNVLPGYGNVTGKALVEHHLVRKVDVTGGTPAGRVIGSIAGANLARFTAELGGKAPVIVTEKADLDLAVNGVAFGAFIASGQTCIAATRIIVHSSILDAFVGRLCIKARSIAQRMGSPENPDSMMGPLVSKRQLDRVTDLVNDSLLNRYGPLVGGQRMTGSSPLDGHDFSRGYYFPPTIFVGDSRMRLWREEAFGPVIVVTKYDTEVEALTYANDCEFGLGAAVWTQDLSQAHRLSGGINSGICWVNTHHRNDPSSPWGGVGSSGVGSENGIDAYHAYTTMKSIIINHASTEEGLANDDWFREGSSNVRYG